MATPRRSPMQMFRRSSHDEDGKIVITFKITVEQYVPFNLIRNTIYPVVKQWAWIKRAKESLNNNSGSKYTLISKHMSNINQGTLFAIYNAEDDTETIRYISSADIENWQITEKELIKFARENLLKKVAFFERTEPLFVETYTGVYCCTKLKEMTSSLLAVPEILNMLPITSNYVIAMPAPDIILISHCHDARALCVIGETCLRHGARDQPANVVRPIKIDRKGGLSFYEGSMVRNEALFPMTEDQLKNCKKTVFKRSRKLSYST